MNNFKTWLENSPSATDVYHQTGENGVRGIITQGFRTGAGQYGEAVYTVLEPPDNQDGGHLGQYVIKSKVDLNGFVIFPQGGTSIGQLSKKIYGTSNREEVIKKLFPNFNAEQLKDAVYGWADQQWMKFWNKNSPGIVFEGRGMKTWVVVYNTSRLQVEQISKQPYQQWFPATSIGLQQIGLSDDESGYKPLQLMQDPGN